MIGDKTTAEPLAQRVRLLTGIADDAALQRVIGAVSSTLAEQLSPSARARLARVLPRERADAVMRAPRREADRLDAFYERVSRREGVEHGFAVEHAQSVCRALGDALDDDGRRQIAACLSDAVARMLAPSAQEPAFVAPRGRKHSLAAGRPGSAHPLSEARPERAQQDSVARS